MSASLTYVTRDGDRWDLIAWQFYRDVSRMSDLIAINAHVPITEQLDAGHVLRIPVIEAAEAALEDLPPWKR